MHRFAAILRSVYSETFPSFRETYPHWLVRIWLLTDMHIKGTNDFNFKQPVKD